MRRGAENAFVNRMPYEAAAAAVPARMRTGADARREARIRADKKNAVKLLAVMMLGIFVLVGMRSYAAIIQHENNVLIEQNENLQAEIDSLSSQIVEETKITKLEKRATEEFGMVYPTPENCIRLSSEDEKDHEGLAASIRSEAYN